MGSPDYCASVKVNQSRLDSIDSMASSWPALQQQHCMNSGSGLSTQPSAFYPYQQPTLHVTTSSSRPSGHQLSFCTQQALQQPSTNTHSSMSCHLLPQNQAVAQPLTQQMSQPYIQRQQHMAPHTTSQASRPPVERSLPPTYGCRACTLAMPRKQTCKTPFARACLRVCTRGCSISDVVVWCERTMGVI